MSDIPNFWRRRGLAAQLLRPLAALFSAAARRRREKSVPVRAAVPIVVVGNVTLGGSGKTPVVQALAREFVKRGIHVGIISRGYGGSNAKTGQALEVLPESDASVVGDEPLLLRVSTGCPAAVAAKRILAADLLTGRYPDLQLLIADDGLQHYALARDVELAVVAPDLGLGNGLCLPAGPLREPPERLETVDAVVFTGQPPAIAVSVPYFAAQMQLGGFTDLSGQDKAVSGGVFAVTAIARPERFFAALEASGLQVVGRRSFSDHSVIPAEALPLEGTVAITAKDAVKTGHWPADLRQRTVVLRYDAVLPDALITFILKRIAI